MSWQTKLNQMLLLLIPFFLSTGAVLAADEQYMSVQCRGAQLGGESRGFLIGDSDSVKVSERFILVSYKGGATRIGTLLEPDQKQCRDYYVDVRTVCKSGSPPRCYSQKINVPRTWNILVVGSTLNISGILSCEIGSQIRKYSSKEEWLKEYAKEYWVDWVDKSQSDVSSLSCIRFE